MGGESNPVSFPRTASITTRAERGRVPRPLRLLARLALGIVVAAGGLAATIDLYTFLFYASYVAVGTLLVVRRPGNVVSWLLIAIAFGFIGTTGSPPVDVDALARGAGTFGDQLMAWAFSWGWAATFFGFLALTLVFPSGHPPAGRWHRAAALLLILSLGIGVLTALQPVVILNVDDSGATTRVLPNPFAVLPDLPIWSALVLNDVGAMADILFIAIGVASMLVRYRKAVGVERLQLRWLVAAMSLVLVGIIVGLASAAVIDPAYAGLGWIPVIIAYPMIPIAIGVAVLRYRLYDIDRVLSRTIAWAVTTGVVLAAFAGLIVGLQSLLAPITSGSTLAVAASTLIAAAVFQPLRRRVQRTVDRRFHRSRLDAEVTIATFAGQVRDEVDLLRLRDIVASAADRAVRPMTLGVWVRDELGRSR